MEKPSPRDSISPSTVGGSSNPPAQPTYTTAGTIYNPNSSQPLQPPTRRGRSHKWTTGGLYPDLSLLPRNFLESLQAITNGRSSPHPTISYTPLQQNYDRAANPMSRNGCVEDMSSRWPLDASEGGEARSCCVSDRDHDGDDEDEDRADSRDGAMKNLTYMSLTNLASYENPNQKKAQKTLSRLTQMRLSLQNPVGANDMPAQHWDHIPSPPVHDRFLAKKRLSNSDSVAPQLMARVELQSITERGQREGRSPPPTSESSEPCGIWLKHTALSAPRPLTAGPPGHRQYRPSTFTYMWKALSTGAGAAKLSEEDDGYDTAARVLQYSGIDDAGDQFEDLRPRQENDAVCHTQLFRGSQTLSKCSPECIYGVVGSPDKSRKRCAAPPPLETGAYAPNDERSGRDPEYEGRVQTRKEMVERAWDDRPKKLRQATQSELEIWEASGAPAIEDNGSMFLMALISVEESHGELAKKKRLCEKALKEGKGMSFWSQALPSQVP